MGRGDAPGGGDESSAAEPVDVTTEDLAAGVRYGIDEGPESQGVSAGNGFGGDAQGTLGDEDYDPSYGPSRPGSVQETGARDLVSREAEVDLGDDVANDERDVATGDLAALQEVRRRTSWSEDGDGAIRSDEHLRGEIEELVGDLDEAEVRVEVSAGEVLLTGQVPTAERRDRVDEMVQDVAGIRSIDNQISVQDELDE